MLHLALVDFKNPLLWAVLVGWIMTVVLHEFAHGIVAYWGGDYTIRDRGGLTLNPLQYVDPVMSIILPVVFLLMGGIPLPGGATYIRRDLLRSNFWQSAVSLAGPLMNFLIFVGFCIPLLPSVGWINYQEPVENWPTGQLFVATMAVLQIFSVFLNLAPVPPLDGYGAIRPLLPTQVQRKLSDPNLRMGLFFGYFLLLNVPKVMYGFMLATSATFAVFGIDGLKIWNAFVICLYGPGAG